MKPSHRILKPLAAIALLAATLAGGTTLPLRADNTLRGKRLKVSASARDAMAGLSPRHEAVYDTIYLPSRDSVEASGYDKPLRTNRETLLITNSTPLPLDGLALTLTYHDMQGRQLHARTDTLHTTIPAGETRMLRLSTWDQQQSYYYHRSRQPRTANVTPYSITCRIDFVLRSTIQP